MAYNNGSKDHDVTKAEGPSSIYRRLLAHFDGLAESVTKIYPRIERDEAPDPFLVRKFCEQLIELARSSEDLAAATEMMFLRKRPKTAVPVIPSNANEITKPTKTEKKS